MDIEIAQEENGRQDVETVLPCAGDIGQFKVPDGIIEKDYWYWLSINSGVEFKSLNNTATHNYSKENKIVKEFNRLKLAGYLPPQQLRRGTFETDDLHRDIPDAFEAKITHKQKKSSRVKTQMALVHHD